MNLSVRKIVISGILGAIAILLGVTRLGFIPVPTPAGHATVMHIPVILGGVLEGPIVGLITGAIYVYSASCSREPPCLPIRLFQSYPDFLSV